MVQRKSDELSILREKAAAKLTKEMEELRKLSAEELKSRYFEIPATGEGVKELENKFKSKIEELQTIFDASHNSIWYKDTKNNFIRVNQAAAKIAGLEIEEIEGRSADEIFPLESDKYYKDDLEVINTGNPKIGIIESFTTKGNTRWVRTDKIPSYTSSGEIAGIIAFSRDITEQKIAEQILIESEALLRTVISNAPISIFSTDENGVFTLHEGKAIDRLGMKAGENVGASAYDLFAGLKVIEHNGQVTSGKSILDRVSKGEYITGITELNGVIFDNQFAPIWGKNGKVAGLLGVATDITEQKQMEKERLEFETRYRMLFNEIYEGFCIVEMIFDENQNPIDYRFLEINPSFEKQTGLIDARGKRMRKLKPKHEDYWFEIYGRIALTGVPERFVNRAEQLHRWYDVYAFRFGQPENRQVAILFNDITERKRMQDELREREEKWHNLFEILPVGVSISDTENNVLEINDALSEIIDISKNELINGAYRNISYLRSDMTPMPPEEIPSRRALNEKKIVRDVEIGIKKEDESIIWTNVSAAPISSFQASVTITSDITQRKQVEFELRKSESNLNEAQHLAKIGSWEWDAVTDTINWSKEYYRIYGLDPQKSPPGYEEHLKVYTPESIEVLDSAVKACMQTGDNYDLELELSSMNESASWVRARGEAKFDIDGKIIGLRGTAQDITEQKKQEELLRYLAEITANLSEGVSLIRENDGIIVHTNRRYDEIFGYNHGELIGKHVSILNAPMSNLNAMETAKTIIKSVQEAGNWKGVVYNIKKDGSFFWSQASVTQFEHSVFGTVLITIQMDITEQVQAEMALLENEIRLRAMIANISDVIAIVDQNGINRFKSPNVEKWFGWKAEELIGENTFDNIHSEDQDQIKHDFYSLLAEPGKVINVECRYQCKDNRYKWIELKAVNQIDNPAISGVLVNYHDVSQQKKAREKIIRHEKELKLLSSELIIAQEKEKKILAIELHDEIGQALTAMKINLSAISKNIPAETNNQVCERIIETDQLLDSIISRIHDISLNLRPAMLDLLGFASTIKSYGQQFSERTGIKVNIENKNNANPDTGHEIHLFRIVQESLTNAAKHAEAQNINIQMESKNKWFYMIIEDDGKGFHTQESGEFSDSSLGLGLIGINERVISMQGEISITSGHRQGTKIEIKVPLNGQKK